MRLLRPAKGVTRNDNENDFFTGLSIVPSKCVNVAAAMLKNEKKERTVTALGVDPGLASTGYALIRTSVRAGELSVWGTLKTSARRTVPARLTSIYDDICEILENWKPGILAIEDVYVLEKFPKAAIQLGEVKGVIYLAAQQHNVTVIKIRPTEVKSCLTGNGRATKEQVNRAVKRMLRMKKEIKPDHASDAAALALVGLSREGYFNW